MPARRTILKLSALLILLGLLALALFIATFDLNRHRTMIEKTLAGALNRPVEIAAAHLSVRHGISLDLSDLRIGPAEEDRSELTASHLFLGLDLPDLLNGQITIDEMVLGEPHLQLRPASYETSKSQPSGPFASERLQNIRIGSLRLEDGIIEVHDGRRPEHPPTLALRNISGRIDDFALAHPGHLEVTGELVQPEGAAAFELSGEVEPPAAFSRWRETDVTLDMNLRHLDPAALMHSFHSGPAADATRGRCSLTLHLNGSPSAGLHFEGNLGGDNFALRFPEHYRNNHAISDVAFSGFWTATADGQRLTDLHLQTEDLALNGHLALSRSDAGHWLEGELNSPPLPLTGLKRLIPDADNPPLFDFLDKRLTDGTLQVEKIRLDGPLAGKLPLQYARARIRDSGLRLPQAGDLKQLGAVLKWEEGRLDVQDGAAWFAGEPLYFSGTLTQRERGPSEVALEAYGSLPAENLFSLLPYRDELEIEVTEPVPISLELTGPTDRLVVDLKSDFKNIAINFGSKLHKSAGHEAWLFATAEITPARLELSHALLSIPPLELRAQGAMQRDPQQAFELALALAPLDMQQTRFRTALIDRFDPQGKISLDYRLSGTEGEIREHGGKLMLREFGMRLPAPLADINGADGEIEIDGGTASIKRLSARLGSSAVTATGTLKTWENPRLDLRVKAPSIRAEDLIFPNADKVFYDVEGHLIITREGLSLDPVSVRLGEDTAATVRGSLENFGAPEVRLDIDAAHADILEIIGLWKRPPGTAKKREGKWPEVRVSIDARVAEGTLGALHFSDARGHIATRGELLVVDPLQFKGGEGSARGQVVLDRSGTPPALLKVSGHLEDISAAGLYSELLRKRGMITGTLSGDFYVEGQVGATFLPTTVGGFNLKVKDGILRRFRFLSHVFSLLNVSQLFEFNLPDVDDQGMPFERLTGNFALRHGTLSTDDLFVKSNAMNLSLVGDADLVENKLDFILGVKPLRTVDKIVTQIPVAGWLLTGDEKALFTAHFLVGGEPDDPEVLPIPITSVSEKVLGIFRRAFSLPGKLITDPKKIFRGGD